MAKPLLSAVSRMMVRGGDQITKGLTLKPPS